MLNATSHPLDPYLPLLELDGPAVLSSADILEVKDMTQLLELARNPKIGQFLLARLSDTVALVDPGTTDDLLKAMRAAGHTPRTTKGLDS